MQQGPGEPALCTLGRIKTAEQFDELIVLLLGMGTHQDQGPGACRGFESRNRGLTRLDGQNAVSLSVQKQSGEEHGGSGRRRGQNGSDEIRT